MNIISLSLILKFVALIASIIGIFITKGNARIFWFCVALGASAIIAFNINKAYQGNKEQIERDINSKCHVLLDTYNGKECENLKKKLN